jgi:uncharacterized protein YbaR (Trm112 family)/SAM-dependent methyltransferase
MAAQSLRNKRAEVDFRRKLMQQNRGEACYFADEPGVADVFPMIEGRIQRTREMISGLVASGLALEPYLEVGAERCQRSLVLENEFGFSGIAADISLDSMLFAGRIAEKYHYSKMPLRVCCDANRLPIRSGSVQFAFCYQTIHHFSDPSPILASICRSLSSTGAFYFDEEPVTMRGRIPLFLRGNKPVGLMQKALAKLRLLDFFSATGLAEAKAGVGENDFTLKQWEDMLTAFQTDDVIVDSRLLHGQKLKCLINTTGISRFWVELMGGNIHGLCRKKQKAGAATEPEIQNPMDMLICPECSGAGIENGLLKENETMKCPSCGSSYPIIKGVVMMFTKKLGTILYPEYYT